MLKLIVMKENVSILFFLNNIWYLKDMNTHIYNSIHNIIIIIIIIII